MDLKNNRGQYIVINIRNRAEINTMTDIKGKKMLPLQSKCYIKKCLKKGGREDEEIK